MFEYDRLALDVAQQFSQQSPKTTTTIFSGLFSDSPSIENGHEEMTRRLSGGSSSNEGFDCGASSGYGSPGFLGTPLASPAPNSIRITAATHIEKDASMSFGDLSRSYDSGSGVAIRQSPHLQLFGSQQAFSVSPLVSGLTFEQVEKCNDRENDDNRRLSSASSLSSNTTSKSNSSTTTSNTMGNTNGSASIEIAPEPALEDGFSPDEIAQFAQLLCSPKKAPPLRYQCHICYRGGHYISDCPMRFNSPYEELTPYQGRKKCYGEFQCQQCKRKWTSQNSVANEAQSCIKCHVPVFPHKQLPVDKAVALGLIKAQRPVPTKMSPIGHGRPPFGDVPLRL